MVLAFLFTLGGTAVGVGVLMRLGILKGWFAIKSSAGHPTLSSGLALIPIGLGFIAIGILFKARLLGILGTYASLDIITCTVFPLWLFGIVLAVWQPDWILPDWYRWLKKNHSEILPLLREEA